MQFGSPTSNRKSSISEIFMRDRFKEHVSLPACQLLPRFTYLLRAGSRSASLSVVAVSKSSIDLIGDDARNVTERPACGDMRPMTFACGPVRILFGWAALLSTVREQLATDPFVSAEWCSLHCYRYISLNGFSISFHPCPNLANASQILCSSRYCRTSLREEQGLDLN